MQLPWCVCVSPPPASVLPWKSAAQATLFPTALSVRKRNRQSGLAAGKTLDKRSLRSRPQKVGYNSCIDCKDRQKQRTC